MAEEARAFLPQLEDVSWRVSVENSSDQLRRLGVMSAEVTLHKRAPGAAAASEQTVTLDHQELSGLLERLEEIQAELAALADKKTA